MQCSVQLWAEFILLPTYVSFLSAFGWCPWPLCEVEWAKSQVQIFNRSLFFSLDHSNVLLKSNYKRTDYTCSTAVCWIIQVLLFLMEKIGALLRGIIGLCLATLSIFCIVYFVRATFSAGHQAFKLPSCTHRSQDLQKGSVSPWDRVQDICLLQNCYIKMSLAPIIASPEELESQHVSQNSCLNLQNMATGNHEKTCPSHPLTKICRLWLD